MKPNTYLVKFEDGAVVRIYAFNINEAIILAQAQQILSARDYTVLSIEEVDDDYWKAST